MSSPFADQGTAAHKVLESCLVSTYQWGMPMLAADFIDLEIEVSDGPHGDLSPSGSKRWMTCPASVAIGADHPEETAPPRKIRITAEDAAAVQDCLNYIAGRVEALGEIYGKGNVQVLPESLVDPGEFFSAHLGQDGKHRMRGTSDVAIVCHNRVEHIDYKHGAGVLVSVEDPQNQLYLLGTLARLWPPGSTATQFQSASVTIVQPRCRAEFTTRTLEIPDVESWRAEFTGTVRSALEAIRSNAAARIPSADGCRWCPAGGSMRPDVPVCRPYAEYSLASIGLVDFPEDRQGVADAAMQFAARDLNTLTPGQVVALLDAREAIAGILRAIEAQAKEQLENGTADPELKARYKLVRGRSNRAWGQDEEKTFAALKRFKILDDGKERALGKKDLYKEVLLGPAPIESLLKGHGVTGTKLKSFELLVTKPEGALQIAPVDDPRAPAVVAIKQPAASVFAGVAQEMAGETTQ